MSERTLMRLTFFQARGVEKMCSRINFDPSEILRVYLEYFREVEGSEKSLRLLGLTASKLMKIKEYQ
jgi:hypothetical protein